MNIASYRLCSLGTMLVFLFAWHFPGQAGMINLKDRSKLDVEKVCQEPFIKENKEFDYKKKDEGNFIALKYLIQLSSLAFNTSKNIPWLRNNLKFILEPVSLRNEYSKPFSNKKVARVKLRGRAVPILRYQPVVASIGSEIKNKGFWDVFDFGAKGDSKTMDTKAIQKAIDACYAQGGGRVYLHSGTFLTGTIYLKSDVSLFIEAGAILLGSGNVQDYPSIPSKYPSYTGEFVTNKMMIYSENAENIAIEGTGKIDGRGDDFNGPYLSPSFSGRPRIIHFRNCYNIKIRDITLYNAGSWVQAYQSCKNIVIDGITVDSRENKDIEKPRYADNPGRNTDGLDLIDCQVVRVTNCFINSGDDAICLKSLSPDEGCRDIIISNCVVSSNASGIKIGTETSGFFEDITIQNCTVYDTRNDAIGLMSVDGARMERIIVSNIVVRNIKGAAIFIRLGNRGRVYRKNGMPAKGSVQNIIVKDVIGTGVSGFGCSITGLPGRPVRNITLRNIRLKFDGGRKLMSTDGDKSLGSESEKIRDILNEINNPVPEREQDYPKGSMFGRLPAYGLYIRHAENILLENITLDFKEKDHRPALVCTDVDGIEINRFKGTGTSYTPSLIKYTDVKKALISNSGSQNKIPVLLGIYGNSSNITLIHYPLDQSGKKSVWGSPSLKSEIKHILLK